VYRYSKGIPRVINMLCEHACLAAYGDGRTTVTGNDVWRVACQFELAGTLELTTEALRPETFCRLPRPKEAKPAEQAVLEPSPLEKEGQLIARTAHQTDEHEPAFDRTAADSIEPLPEVFQTVAAVRHPRFDDEAALVLPVTEPVLEVALAIQSVAEVPEPICLREANADTAPACSAQEAEGLAPIESACESASEFVIAISGDALCMTATKAVQEIAIPSEPRSEPVSEPVFAMKIDTLSAGSRETMQEDSATLPELVCESAPGPVSEPVSELAPELSSEPIFESTPKVHPAPQRVTAAVRGRRADLLVQLKASLPNRHDLANAAPITAVLRFAALFIQYWRSVGRSFVRDVRQLLTECEALLQSSVNIEQDAATMRRLALSLSTWLKQPVGLVRRQHPRVPSTAHKHP
jgi:hypothetical protein